MSSPIRRVVSVAVFASLASLTACGGGGDGGLTPPTTPPPPAPVASVVVAPDGQTLPLAQTTQLSAITRDAAGNTLTGRTIDWSAAPASVGTVSTAGVVTAVAPGTLTVTATSEGKSGTAQVNVVNNNPVATVSVSAPVTALIPAATAQLAAVLKDAANNTLTGRAVAWTASPSSVGTVSANGLVTAVAPGRLTVTATSEGKSANAVLSVLSGAVVGPTGGTITLSGGDVEIQVPAGAVAAGTTFTSEPLDVPSAPTPAGWQPVGKQYALGPVNTTFAQPVTVKFKFKSGDLPPFAMSGDLRVRLASAGQWTNLTNVVVDAANRTISGRTTTFGAAPSSVVSASSLTGVAGFGQPTAPALRVPGPTTGISAQDPTISLSPASGSVNFQQRSVTLFAVLAPNGTGVPLPANTPALLYRWTTTGRNGAISGPGPTQWTTTTDVQYTATNAVLNQLSGPIDDVKVEVLLNPTETDPTKQRVISATATIDADLNRTYDITPSSPVIGPGTAQSLQLVIRDKAGALLTLPTNQSLAWSSSANFGNIGTPGPRQETITYQANSTFNNPPPRVDDVVVKITEQRSTVTRVFKPAIFGTEGAFDETTVVRTVDIAEKKDFVEVKVNYQITLSPPSKTLGVNANTTLSVTMTPAYTGPGLMYKYTNPGAYGTLNVANGVRTTATTVTYTANATGGGTDKVRVEVVSVVAGVELESLGTAESNIQVDPLSAGFAVVVNPTPGGWFTGAQISIPKITGATSYDITAATPDGPYARSFSGATSSDQNSVNQVLDGGTVWKINLEGGFNTILSAQQARANLYQTKYGSVVFRITVNF